MGDPGGGFLLVFKQGRAKSDFRTGEEGSLFLSHVLGNGHFFHGQAFTGGPIPHDTVATHRESPARESAFYVISQLPSFTTFSR
jgi:hypothetical protein